MNNDNNPLGPDDLLPEAFSKALPAESSARRRAAAAHVSPLGWSIGGRLLCALAASALLWLAVAWAIGWL